MELKTAIEILECHQEWRLGEKEEMKYKPNEITEALDILLEHAKTRSFGIVRWHENEREDVVCKNKETAEEYARKYNKLSGKEICYVDHDIFFPLNEA